MGVYPWQSFQGSLTLGMVRLLQWNQLWESRRLAVSIKIHMAVDSFGLSIEFKITGGQVDDCKVALGLLPRSHLASSLFPDRGLAAPL